MGAFFFASQARGLTDKRAFHNWTIKRTAVLPTHQTPPHYGYVTPCIAHVTVPAVYISLDLVIYVFVLQAAQLMGFLPWFSESRSTDRALRARAPRCLEVPGGARGLVPPTAARCPGPGVAVRFVFVISIVSKHMIGRFSSL